MTTDPQNDRRPSHPSSGQSQQGKSGDQNVPDKVGTPDRKAPQAPEPENGDLDEMLEQTFPASDPLPGPGEHKSD